MSGGPLAPAPVAPAPVAPPAVRLRVGVIGLGMGRGHIVGWREHPRVDVAALADPDATRLALIGDEFGITGRYASAQAMLAAEALDVVSVCTPNRLHLPLTLSAIETDCHVLCEKPMAINAAEGRVMLAAARRAGKRLMINFSFRFTAESRALKAQVDAGVFGDFYFGRSVWHRRHGMPGFGGWFSTQAASGGGPLIDLGVHRLDLALWLMGHPKPTWVMGATYDPIARAAADRAGKPYDVEDLAAAFIRFENGTSLVLEASWAAHIREAELMETRLLGTQAGLLQHKVAEGDAFEAHVFQERDGVQHDVKLRPGAIKAPSAMHDDAQAILAGTRHPASGEDGLAVMTILVAIYASARSGAPVQIA